MIQLNAKNDGTKFAVLTGEMPKSIQRAEPGRRRVKMDWSKSDRMKLRLQFATASIRRTGARLVADRKVHTRTAVLVLNLTRPKLPDRPGRVRSRNIITLAVPATFKARMTVRFYAKYEIRG